MLRHCFYMAAYAYAMDVAPEFPAMPLRVQAILQSTYHESSGSLSDGGTISNVSHGSGASQRMEDTMQLSGEILTTAHRDEGSWVIPLSSMSSNVVYPLQPIQAFAAPPVDHLAGVEAQDDEAHRQQFLRDYKQSFRAHKASAWQFAVAMVALACVLPVVVIMRVFM